MIPVSEPCITECDIELVNDALKSGWISSAGKYLDLFENRWAAYCGMPYGIAVSNGSVALDVAIGLVAIGFVATLAWARLIEAGHSGKRGEKP